MCNVDIGVAELGVAGPNKRRTGEPVGLSFIAISTNDHVICNEYNF
eukprot:CAMPEP_0168315322 /NCGR_PEP_ID=MMETSP0210-20121227/10812_1 /TAXON_ID=40633 /ORGANISM="Condylostoma magnum, Strain COL2" /LENGTH=45 /DNA_ID= /DNA_START= /DNA_END= /DNA_ORIENTATION=